ncbi:MAG: hypothetical protein HQL38_02430 [Alphaproteobacteria bacterium]|nr:hypothetical protein [Alphaproteobacteria bacterium]
MAKELPDMPIKASRLPKNLDAHVADMTADEEAKLQDVSKAVGFRVSASSTLPSPEPKPSPEAAPRIDRTSRFNALIPSYVEQQIADICHAKRCTKTHLLLAALKATYGIRVDEVDLVADARRPRAR